MNIENEDIELTEESKESWKIIMKKAVEYKYYQITFEQVSRFNRIVGFIRQLIINSKLAEFLSATILPYKNQRKSLQANYLVEVINSIITIPGIELRAVIFLTYSMKIIETVINELIIHFLPQKIKKIELNGIMKNQTSNLKNLNRTEEIKEDRYFTHAETLTQLIYNNKNQSYEQNIKVSNLDKFEENKLKENEFRLNLNEAISDNDQKFQLIQSKINMIVEKNRPVKQDNDESDNNETLLPSLIENKEKQSELSLDILALRQQSNYQLTRNQTIKTTINQLQKDIDERKSEMNMLEEQIEALNNESNEINQQTEELEDYPVQKAKLQQFSEVKTKYDEQAKQLDNLDDQNDKEQYNLKLKIIREAGLNAVGNQMSFQMQQITAAFEDVFFKLMKFKNDQSTILKLFINICEFKGMYTTLLDLKVQVDFQVSLNTQIANQEAKVSLENKKNEVFKAQAKSIKKLEEQQSLMQSKAKEEHMKKEEKKKFMGDNTKSAVQKSLNLSILSKLQSPIDIQLNSFIKDFRNELDAQIESLEGKLNQNKNLYQKDQDEFQNSIANMESMCEFMLELEKLVGHELRFNK